jgi:hypothetical protein
MFCRACQSRRHGPACDGCDCRCRAMLGLDLFDGGDPTAPTVIDRVVA